MPVRLEKPAHLVALAESWFGYAQANRNFAVVTLDQTTGLGLWLENDLHRGASTLGPAFGHIKVGQEGRRCDCGQADCLNAYVSIPALIDDAKATLGPDFPAALRTADSFLAAMTERAAEGDARAQQVIARQGRMLGIGVSHIINLVNPEKIIIAVESAQYGAMLDPSLRASAAENSFRAHFASTELIFHTLDDQLWARGAAALMLRDIYSAPWTANH